MSPKSLFGIVAAVAVLASSPASAGKRAFFWVYDTEVLPARNVEVEQWVWEARRFGDEPMGLTSLWWAPVVGLTDQVELAVPVEWFWYRVPQPAGGPPPLDRTTGVPLTTGTHLETAGVDLRIRLASIDPEEAGPLVPLVRVGLKRLLRDADGFLAEGNLVLGYDPVDWLHTSFDVGLISRLDELHLTATYAAGASVRLNEELRFGAELFGEYFVTPRSPGLVMAGPNLSYAAGRFWLTAGALFGLNKAAATVMPRIIWAVAF